MSFVNVDVYVLNKLNDVPLESVLVRVFDAANTTFFDEATTDNTGRAGFTLPSQTYALRFFKFAAHVQQPQMMEVLETPTLQAFTARATIFAPQPASDPRLCRASGFFRDVTGAPHPSVDMHFVAQFDPILLEGSAILSERRVIRSQKDGFACIDLIRGAKYRVVLQGLEDSPRDISVPDLPSVNLPDLLFPVIEEVSFSLPGPYSMLVDDKLELTPLVLGSNKVPLVGTANSDVIWTSSNPTIVAVAVASDILTLNAISAGTAELRATRRNKSIIRIPNTSIVGVPQTITVS